MPKKTSPKKTSPIWHPFTQHALQPDMVKIARGEGAYLFAADGRRIRADPGCAPRIARR